jgi:hypothetical protein
MQAMNPVDLIIQTFSGCYAPDDFICAFQSIDVFQRGFINPTLLCHFCYVLHLGEVFANVPVHTHVNRFM